MSLFSISYFIFVVEMPIRAKKQVVEKYLEGRRLTEEKVLLERDDWIFRVLQRHCYSRNLINN